MVVLPTQQSSCSSIGFVQTRFPRSTVIHELSVQQMSVDAL